jgi:hypothetical protein
MPDSVGLYNKFIVTRTDGTSAEGLKHYGCQYFVLDLDHDKHAMAAIRAYAKSCKRDYPELSKDLLRIQRDKIDESFRRRGVKINRQQLEAK